MKFIEVTHGSGYLVMINIADISRVSEIRGGNSLIAFTSGGTLETRDSYGQVICKIAEVVK